MTSSGWPSFSHINHEIYNQRMKQRGDLTCAEQMAKSVQIIGGDPISKLPNM